MDTGREHEHESVTVQATATPESFEEVFRRGYPRLVRTLCFVALDQEAAADIAQEAFFQLHLDWGRIGHYEDPLAWVYKVALHRCTDYRRRLARFSRLFERLAGQEQRRDEVAWYPERVFMEALAALPKRQRKAAALHYVAGFSQKETATAMGISEGAVKSHLSRARDSLQSRLEVEHE